MIFDGPTTLRSHLHAFEIEMIVELTRRSVRQVAEERRITPRTVRRQISAMATRLDGRGLDGSVLRQLIARRGRTRCLTDLQGSETAQACQVLDFREIAGRPNGRRRRRRG